MLAERTFAYAGVMQAIVGSVANEDGQFSTLDLMDDPNHQDEEEDQEEPEIDSIMASIPMETL